MSSAAFLKKLRRAGADPLFWLIAAGFFVGLGHLFATPPFEGFDETAHYASIQIVADEGRIPVYGRDRLSRDVAGYFAAAPGPYATVPPFHETGRPTYAEVFSDAEAEEAARATIESAPVRRYAPEGVMNWQAQHPPLAYVALAPVYAATKEAAWKTHVFWLRLACFAFATMGLAVGALAMRKAFGAAAGVVLAAWPFYMPMYFPEMARIGNDAFCLFFMGAGWAALLRLLTAPPGARLIWAAALGLALGLGALTKAFFPPVAAGLFVLLALRGFAGGANARTFAPAAVFALVFAAIAGAWYAAKLIATGSFTGANDFIAFAAQDAAHPLSALAAPGLVLQRIASIYASFLWAGSWSLAKPPYWTLIPLGAGFGAVLAAWLYEAARNRLWLAAKGAPLFIVAPVVSGLCYHVLTQIALGPAGVGTPGWYLHIFVAPLGFAVFIGARRLWKFRVGRAGLLAAFSYALAFGAALQYMQLTLFTGCSVKFGDNRFYQPTDCFSDPLEIMRRLEVVANPAGMAVALLLGTGAFCLALSALFAKVAAVHSAQSGTHPAD